MWNTQQMQRYSGPHANIPTSSAMSNSQIAAAMVPRVSGTLPPEMQQHYAARRPPFCLQASGPTMSSAVPGSTTRLRVSFVMLTTAVMLLSETVIASYIALC